MRAQHDNIVLRQTFILIVAGAFTANAQTLVGSLGAMGIAGTLQSINSTAAINGLNAANGLTGINAQQNAAVNQALNGTPPQWPAAGRDLADGGRLWWVPAFTAFWPSGAGITCGCKSGNKYSECAYSKFECFNQLVAG